MLGQMVASVAGSYRASVVSTVRPVGWPIWDKMARCVCECYVATLTVSAG